LYFPISEQLHYLTVRIECEYLDSGMGAGVNQHTLPVFYFQINSAKYC